jgi:hypothetical protein
MVLRLRRPVAPPTCTHRDCGWIARWRPVVYAPLLEDDLTVSAFVRLPLPIVVCTQPKLPRRDWRALSHSKLRSLVRRRYGSRVRLELAWIAHELIDEPDA